MQEKDHAKRKMLYICFINPTKQFLQSTEKGVGRTIRKKGTPEVFDGSVICQYKEAKTRFSGF